MVEVRLPAFTDSHVHLAQTGLLLAGLDLAPARSRDEVLEAVARHARASSDPVVLGFGWDETRWPDPSLPTAAELDRATDGQVVLLSRVDGHSALVSGAVLDRAPQLAETAGWSPDGRVQRAAGRMAREVAEATITRSQRKAAIARALDAAAAAGLGCVHEMSAPHINAEVDLELIRELAGERDQIAVVPYWGEHVDADGVRHAVELGCAGAAGDLNIDGAFGSRTAGLSEPYVDLDPDDPAAHGFRYLDAEAVARHVVACTRAGIQAGFHCIGDAGTSAAAEGFRLASQQVGKESLRAARHRLEHLELIEPELIADLASNGVVVSAQPAFDSYWGGEDGMYARRLGVHRALATNPFAALVQASVPLAFGSDSPVTPFDPWGAVRAATLHHQPDSRLSTSVAFAAHTDGGRYASGPDPASGQPTNAWVDWWFDTEPAADRLPRLAAGDRTPRCLRTVVDGRTVYDRTVEEGHEH